MFTLKLSADGYRTPESKSQRGMASAIAVGNILLSDTFNLHKLSPYSESLVEKLIVWKSCVR